MLEGQYGLGEKLGDFLIRPWVKILDTLWTTALFAFTGVIYAHTEYSLFETLVYVASVIMLVLYLRYLAHRAEKRRLERAKQMDWFRRLTYEHASEVISPAQTSLFRKLDDSILSASSEEEKEFIMTFIGDLLEDVTTRVFEADARASDVGIREWASHSFKATLMTKRAFTEDKFRDLLCLIENDKEMTDEEKEQEKQGYKNHVNTNCMFLDYWFYPGNAHPESLGIPYMLNEGVAGMAWFKKSLVIWTPSRSCTPRLEIARNTFAEKYRGQQAKYVSMVCLPIESIHKEGKFLVPSNKGDDGILGILTMTCEREEYFKPTVDFAKYLQTLLAPYVALLSYALERLYGRKTLRKSTQAST